MNYTEADDHIMNSTAANQSQLSVSDDSSDVNSFSLAARVVNGIVISSLFTFGIAANLVVLHVLKVRGILLKNTSVILTNLMITDLICCLVILPQEFALYVVDASFPHAKKMFKVCSVLKNAMIFLNCGFTMVLSVERRITATYIGRRRSRHLSKSLMLCLATVWLSSLGNAAVTYYTFKDGEHLPWKLSGQTTSASSRCPSAGTILAWLVVLLASLTVLFSLHRMRSFLHRINTDAKEAFQSFSKSETRRRKIQKRITFSSFASLVTFAVSYLPIATTWLLWYGLGRQTSDANSFAHVLCSLAHTINPLIATAMSSRLQNAFVKILKSFYPFHALLKRYPSFANSITSFNSQSMPDSPLNHNLENVEMMNNNSQDTAVIINANSQEVSSTEDIFVPGKVGVSSIAVWDRYISDKKSNRQATIVKKEPLTRKRSSSAGAIRSSHHLSVPHQEDKEDRIKRLSGTFIKKI